MAVVFPIERMPVFDAEPGCIQDGCWAWNLWLFPTKAEHPREALGLTA
ncbi:MAG: hypothetical protein IPJ41_17955 [Phycisphaerales bacterium]|nr:hypothetical protein [Phycisphaerales bacterium]